MTLERLIARLEWAAAAGFLFLRPVVTGPSADLDARVMNALLSALSWSPLLLSLLRTALAGDAALRAPRIPPPVLAAMAALGLATWAAPDKAFAFPRAAELGGALALFLWVSQQERPVGLRAAWLLIAGAAVCVAVGLFQAGGGLALLREEIRLEMAARDDPASPFREPAWMASLRESRLETDEIFGTLFPFYSNTYAGFLAMALPLFAGGALAAFRSGGKPLLGTLLAAAGSASLFCLVRTGSRGGFLAAAAGGLFFLARSRGVAWKKLAAGCLLFFVLAGTAVWAGAHHPSVRVRIGYWKGTAAMALDRLWAGVGPGSAHLAYDAYRSPGAGDVRFAHNAVLELAAEGGILLAAAFAWLAVRVFPRPGPLPAPVREQDPEGGFPFAWGALVIAGGLALSLFWDLFPRTSYREAEAILTAASAVVTLAIWSLSCGRGKPLESPFLVIGIESAVAAGLFHALVDFDLQIAGFAGFLLPLAGILAGFSAGRPCPLYVGLAQRTRILLIALAGLGGFFLTYRQPVVAGTVARERAAFQAALDERAGPDELRETARARLGAAREAAPWDTEILVEHARVLGFLWHQDRKEADRREALALWKAVEARRPWSGQPPLERALLHGPGDPPEQLVEAVRLLWKAAALLPAWPRPRLELARLLEGILSDDARVAAWAAAEELPLAAARDDLSRAAGRLYREALALDASVPDVHHKLSEAERRLIRERLGE